MTLQSLDSTDSSQRYLGTQKPVSQTDLPVQNKNRKKAVLTRYAGRQLSVVASKQDAYTLPSAGLRWMRPVIYLQVNLNRILDRQALAELPPLQRDQFTNCLVTSREEIDSKDIVYLRISPQSNGLIYEFIDRNASDLAGCYYVFARIIGYKAQAEAMLNHLSAPSFSGKKAMDLIWNLVKMAKIKNMLFSDVSTIVSCCDAGALTSLHLMEIFEKGRSWYSTQGASVHIRKQCFRTLFETEFIERKYAQALKGKLKDKRVNVTPSYDQFFFQYMTFYFEGQPSEEAYRKACRFLHKLKIGELENAYINLSSSYREAQEVYSVLFRASLVTKLTTKEPVGKLIEKATAMGHYIKSEDRGKQTTVEKVSNHTLMHEVRDAVVSNKRSFFFRYIVNKLQTNQERADPTLCAFVFLVLDNLFKKLEGLSEYVSSTNKNFKPTPEVMPWVKVDRLQKEKDEASDEEDVASFCTSSSSSSSSSQVKARSYLHSLAAKIGSKRQGLSKVKLTHIVYGILHPSSAADLQSMGIQDVTSKVCQAFLTMIESRTTSPVSAKILLNSNGVNRTKWVEYSEETGNQDDMAAPQAALQYFVQLTINELRELCPDLVNTWKERYQEIKNCGSTYKVIQLIEALQHNEKAIEVLFDDLLRGAMKYLSRLSCALFDRYERSDDKNQVYELFMISKYLCKRRELFALYS